MSNEEDNRPHPHPHQGKLKKMRTSSTINHHHHLFDLFPHLFDLLSEQVINLFNLLPEEVIIDQILLKLPEESLFPEQEQVMNPFDLLPEEVIIDQILLKLPVESLLSLRCVSKCFRSLISNPSFVRLHTQLAEDHHSDLILFSTRDPKQVIGDVVFSSCPSLHGVLVQGCAHDYLIRNYICKFSAADRRDTSRPEVVEEMNCPFPFTDIRASCNGLLYVHGRLICIIKSLPHCCFSQGGSTRISPSYIWNPSTKEYKELPPPPLIKEDQQPVVHFYDSWDDDSATRSYYPSGFCGFGYDRANDEYKILYYEQLSSKLFPTTEFKVYTLGTNTWTSISDNPYKSLIFAQQWLRIGLFVSGALHWIMSEAEDSSTCSTLAKIISFDIEKEVFTEIQKPPPGKDDDDDEYCYTNLQMLQGCLCVCQFPKENWREGWEGLDLWMWKGVDLWMLKDYAAKDSWTKFLRVLIRPGNFFNYFKGTLSIRDFKLLRYCENGEIAMLTNSNDLVLYYPYYPIVTPVESKFKEDVKGRWQYQMNFRKSLVSLNSGTYTR